MHAACQTVAQNLTTLINLYIPEGEIRNLYQKAGPSKITKLVESDLSNFVMLNNATISYETLDHSQSSLSDSMLTRIALLQIIFPSFHYCFLLSSQVRVS